ncbi:MAG: hypothetical protein ACRDJ2_16820 [Actinomycetota bacterium]
MTEIWTIDTNLHRLDSRVGEQEYPDVAIEDLLDGALISGSDGRERKPSTVARFLQFDPRGEYRLVADGDTLHELLFGTSI